MSVQGKEYLVAELIELIRDARALDGAKPKPQGSGLYRMSELPEAHQSAGEKLIEARIREIGETLLSEGGHALMLDAFYLIDQAAGSETAGWLQQAWEGIGGWRA